MRVPNEHVEIGLLGLLDCNDFPSEGHTTCFKLGMAIVKNPQPLIDALVEAGVLERTDNGWWSEGPLPHGSQPAYRVLPPHVHRWFIRSLVGDDRVGVTCLGCSQTRTVPAQFPIEIPE